MGHDVVGKRFAHEWIVVPRRASYRNVQFVDCVLIAPKSAAGCNIALHNVQMQNCTLVGAWPQWMIDSTRFSRAIACGDEPEVVAARLNRSAPRQRRSIFNWRKRG